MGKRSKGRKLAMQSVYQAALRNEDITPVLESFLEEHKKNLDETTELWTVALAKATWTHKEESDQLIETHAIDWDLDRISQVDRSILRLAFYELNHTETPLNVVLNEAIELAKKYASEDSSKFINGILGKYVAEKKD